MVSAIFCLLLGALLMLGAIVAWAMYLAVPSVSLEAQLARLEQLRAERRLQRITQDAVAQMLDIVRHPR